MLSLILPLAAFWALFLVSCLRLDYRRSLKNKPRAAWLMDMSGLLVQGWLIPLMQAYLLLPLYHYLVPEWQSTLRLPFWTGFLLSFVAVDYLYYWNHRFLHTRGLWPWHRAHHSAESMDIFVSSRNSLWTHLLICYVWVHSLAIFFLHDSSGYLLGIALSSALDLWRHSGMKPPYRWQRRLGRILVLPRDHAWHHAVGTDGKNFGANLNLWDKIHKTWQNSPESVFEVGDPEHKLRYRDLLRPIPSQN